LDQPVAKRVRKAKSVRRQEIVEAAVRVMAMHGFRGTSVARIAKAVGISNSALYQHFHNRDEVLVAATDLLGERAREWMINTPGTTALERLEMIGQGHLAWAASSVDSFVRPVFALAGASEGECIEQSTPRTVVLHYDLLVDIVREGQREGSIRSDVDPGDLAWAILMFAWAEDMALLTNVEAVTTGGASHRNFKLLLAAYAPPRV
jgi:TetR/AcrR family transcriptional regulator, fatty acid metabolism regulator protein